ncbi:hypothetical protein AN219_28870, partial [Streptomyces nanshensis]
QGSTSATATGHPLRRPSLHARSPARALCRTRHTTRRPARGPARARGVLHRAARRSTAAERARLRRRLAGGTRSRPVPDTPAAG